MFRTFAKMRKFSTANAPLSMTPKFFLLSYELNDIENNEEILLTEQTYEYLRPFEEQRIMHFYSKLKKSNNFMMIFQGDNEVVPYDFLTGVRF